MEKLLTISIPTYNRSDTLAHTLDSIIALNLGDEVEIVVINNASTDDTEKIIEDRAQYIKSIRNQYNVGLEANIICALGVGTGSYIWTVSDHMIFIEKGVADLLRSLRSGTCFDIGCVGVVDYGGLELPKNQSFHANRIPLDEIGKMLFCVSNISGVIVNRNEVKKNIRSIYRFAWYAYPHLGAYCRLFEGARLQYFPACVRFYAEGKQSSAQRKDYDTLLARFHDFTVAITHIVDVECRRRVVGGANWHQGFLSALRFELLTYVIAPKDARSATKALAKIFWVNGNLIRCLVSFTLIARVISLILTPRIGSKLFNFPFVLAKKIQMSRPFDIKK